jgi:hypothetical protein
MLSNLAIVPALDMIVSDLGTKQDSVSTLALAALADALFAPVQQPALGLPFGHAGRLFQSPELVPPAGASTEETQRALKRLAASGLARVVVERRQEYYRTNLGLPVFETLRGLTEKSLNCGADRVDAKEIGFLNSDWQRPGP